MSEGKKGLGKLFRKSTPKTPTNTGPLQQDMAQAQLIAAVKTRQSRDNSPNSGPEKKRFNFKASPKKGTTGGKDNNNNNKPKPGMEEGASPAAAGGPPPPPPKKGKTDDEEGVFLFCVECGARNKPSRTHCVKCNEELEIPEGLFEQQQKVEEKAVDPDECLVEGEGIISGPQVAGGEALFRVELKDEDGKSVSGKDGKLEVLVEGPSGEITAEVAEIEGEVGCFSVAYDRSEHGAYQVMVTFDDEELGEAPYVLDVLLVVSAEKSSASGQALEDGVFANVPVEFSVETRDVCGVPCTSGGSEVEVSFVQVEGAPSRDEAKDPEVEDLEDGVFDVSLTYPAPGVYEVSVLVNGAPMSESPVTVNVSKKPSAGSKWQAQFEAEAEERRKKREEERLAEIESAKSNFLQQAEEAKAIAAEKEREELAEKRRQEEIAEHMERMRTEEGDHVRAEVLEKVRAQASSDIYEPTDEGAESSGKKWAAQDRKEREEREAARQLEREEEIAKARENYVEHASEAVSVAAAKEREQLAEEKRQREIEEHQRKVRLENNLGGIAVLEGDGEDSGQSVSEPKSGDNGTKEDLAGDVTRNRSDSHDDDSISSGESLGDDDLDIKTGDISSLTKSDEDSSIEGVRESSPGAPVVHTGDTSSEITASSEEESYEEDAPAVVVPKVRAPRADRNSIGRRAGAGGRSPRKGRGDIPDSGGLVIAYADLRDGAAKYAHSDDVNVECLEAYLSDEEFQKVMAVSREKFYQLPSWRRQQLKKEKHL